MTAFQEHDSDTASNKTGLFWEPEVSSYGGVWVVYFNEAGWQTQERDPYLGTYDRLGDATLALFEAWQTYHREAMERAQAAISAARALGGAL